MKAVTKRCESESFGTKKREFCRKDGEKQGKFGEVAISIESGKRRMEKAIPGGERSDSW